MQNKFVNAEYFVTYRYIEIQAKRSTFVRLCSKIVNLWPPMTLANWKRSVNDVTMICRLPFIHFMVF